MAFNVEDTEYYKQAKEKEKDGREAWPPKFMKFLLKCEAENVGGVEREELEVAFVDKRRLARIRLVECEAEKIRDASPLKENGPDPVRDKDILTVDWLKTLLRRKRVPVKALLLDQSNISGVGNWVADEVLYQARIHPEQYSNTFDDTQIQHLHDSLMSVCTLAVETLADSTKFPEDWIMKYRWDKGKKDANVLPDGEKIVHLKVGGRTSAIVPSRQRKTDAVAGDVDGEGGKGRKRKAKVEDEDEDEDGDEDVKPAKKGRGRQKVESDGVKVEEEEAQGNGGAEEESEKPGKTTGRQNVSTPKKAGKPATPGSRRSARTQGK